MVKLTIITAMVMVLSVSFATPECMREIKAPNVEVPTSKKRRG